MRNQGECRKKQKRVWPENALKKIHFSLGHNFRDHENITKAA